MNRTEKSAQIDKVRERFEKAVATVIVDFKGMTVEAVTQLRRDFKKANVEYKVVKNTLIRQALKNTPFKGIVGNLETRAKDTIHPSVRGMTGVAWCYEDPSAAAKVIEKFKKEKGALGEKLAVKAGLLGGQVRERQWVEKEMARLPGLKETQASILATIAAPAQNTVAIINAPAQNLVYVLGAWVRKLEEQQGATPAA